MYTVERVDANGLRTEVLLSGGWWRVVDPTGATAAYAIDRETALRIAAMLDE